MKAALLLGSPTNAHLAALAEELPRAGLAPRIFDPTVFPRRSTLSLRMRPDGKRRASASEVDLRGVAVAWFSSLDGPRVSGALVPGSRAFAKAAASAALVSLRQALDVPWVNDPWRAAPASDKLWQLALARERGFAVPDTLVTNDPAQLRRFAARRALAVKSPSGSAGLPEEMRVLTQRVRASELPSDEEIRAAPVMAQAYVPKASEIRATVVGSSVHAVEIFSQETASTRVDWRRYDHRTRYEKVQLPAPIRRRCVQVAKDVGLDYGGIDLVRTQRDELVFLEVNSEPAWLWIEDLVGLPITRAIARLLARRAKP